MRRVEAVLVSIRLLAVMSNDSRASWTEITACDRPRPMRVLKPESQVIVNPCASQRGLAEEEQVQRRLLLVTPQCLQIFVQLAKSWNPESGTERFALPVR